MKNNVKAPKNLLIIYPHRPPSNLVGALRPRLVANFTHKFGWHSIWLSVNPKYYEEPPSEELVKLLHSDIEIIDVEAFNVTKPRIIGDIGLRGFWQLYKKALHIIESQNIQFVWIPIPSFYTALIGRLLHEKTKIPYGIDYIDPWVRDISNRANLRARFSILAAKILEPIAVKKASLITGVSAAYYKPVLERNFSNKTIAHVASPYGFDPKDLSIKPQNKSYPWENKPNTIPIIYAGAFLPNSGLFAKHLFTAIKALINTNLWNPNIHFYFIGTGNYIHKSVMEYATEQGVAEFVTEDRNRHAYLNVLDYLNNAAGIVILGSTEKHYTASKTFQALLSNTPVFTVFHTKSSAYQIMHETNAANYTIGYQPNFTETELQASFKSTLSNFVLQNSAWKPNLEALNKYSAEETTKAILRKIEEITPE